LGVFIAWWRARARTIAAGGFRFGRADALAFLLGLGVLAGAAVLGFGAGVTAAIGVAEWLGLDRFADV
jgi:hypothetical protein